MRVLLFALLLGVSSTVFGMECQDALKAFYDCSGSIDWTSLSSAALAFLVAASVILRLVAEGLGYIANKTENTWDNRLAATLASWTKGLATVIGWFGFNTPKTLKK